jgi:hypothetical protein
MDVPLASPLLGGEKGGGLPLSFSRFSFRLSRVHLSIRTAGGSHVPRPRPWYDVTRPYKNALLRPASCVLRPASRPYGRAKHPSRPTPIRQQNRLHSQIPARNNIVRMLSPLRPLPFFVFLVFFVVNLPFVVPNGGRVKRCILDVSPCPGPPLQKILPFFVFFVVNLPFTVVTSVHFSLTTNHFSLPSVVRNNDPTPPFAMPPPPGLGRAHRADGAICLPPPHPRTSRGGRFPRRDGHP